QARARAEAVNGFLVGMFEQADPKRALGANLTAAELVGRGTERLDTDLRDQPEVRAALLVTLSRVHGALGHWPRAHSLAREAVALREPTAGVPLAEALVQLSEAARHTDATDEAERALNRALALQRAAYGPAHGTVAKTLHNLALVRHDQGKYDDAEVLHRQAISLRRALAPQGDEVLSSLSGLAQTLRSQSRYAEAEAVYREVLTARRARLPAHHPSVIGTQRQLAQVLNYQDRNDEAERLFRESLRGADEVLAPTHPDTIGIVNDLASLLHDRRRYDDAEPLYVRAVGASRAEGNDSDLATQINNLATLYEDQGRFADARPLYIESLALRRSARGPRHPVVGTALNNLGRLEATRGDLPAASRLLDEALSIRLEANGPRHALTARTRYNVGRVHRMRGQWRAARQSLDEALSIQHERLTTTHPHTLATRLERARTSVALSDFDAAETDARFVLEARSRDRDAQPWELAEARVVLAASLSPKRNVEARTLLDAARTVLAASGQAHVLIRDEADRVSARLTRRSPVTRLASTQLAEEPR
ncbi:MAG TPA: tetratricopeptide repeat protein, partial [Luteitalea sp.]|nr:tetratricopeptide repeat protein [Luteitalea sp.]